MSTPPVLPLPPEVKVFASEPTQARPDFDVPLLGPRTTPVAKVQFFLEGGEVEFSQTANKSVRPGPFDSDLSIISMSWEDDLGQPSGAWSVTFHDRPIATEGPYKGRHLIDVLEQNDLVLISAGRSSDRSEGGGAITKGRQQSQPPGLPGLGQLTPWGFGLVGGRPQVSTEVDASSGQVMNTVTVQGFSLGKLLLQAAIAYFADIPGLNTLVGQSAVASIVRGNLLRQDFQDKFGGGNFLTSKPRLAAFLLQRLLYDSKLVSMSWRRASDGRGKPTKISDVASLISFRCGRMHVFPDIEGDLGQATLSILSNLLNQDQDLYTVLANSVIEPTWGEVFVDTWMADFGFPTAMTGPAISRDPPEILQGHSAYICTREAPFSRDAWSRLPRFNIGDEVVRGVQIGGSPSLYNVFYAPAMLTGIGDTNMNAYRIPYVNPDSFARHGYRPLVVQTQCVNMASVAEPIGQQDAWRHKSVGDAAMQSQRFSEVLFRHHSQVHRHLGGTLTVQGNSIYRKGCVLRWAQSRIFSPITNKPTVFEFYLEGVSRSWSAFGTWVDTLRVTRGLDEADEATRFPEPTQDNFLQGSIINAPPAGGQVGEIPMDGLSR